MDHHDTAATDIPGARISDRERKADRHRRVHRVAAAIEDLDAYAGGAALLCHHHAVVSEDRGRWPYRRCERDRRDLAVGKRVQQQGDSECRDLGEAFHRLLVMAGHDGGKR
jgi:hypothetical protein